MDCLSSLWLLFVVWLRFQNCRCFSLKKDEPSTLNTNISVDLYMPGIKPDQDEQYTCFAFKADQSGYIVQFIPTASSDRVHHLLLYGCEVPGFSVGNPWICLHHSVCDSGNSKILYAWARNAPPLDLPQNVGVPVGPEHKLYYYVLQVHYATTFVGNTYDYSGVTMTVSSLLPRFIGNIYLLFASSGRIPPKTNYSPMNISCNYQGKPNIYPFAYRTHAHGLGRIITGYKYNEKDGFTLIGKGNPQWPQRFYSVTNPIKISTDDYLTAQCIFNSSNRETTTHIGAQNKDEMCNFYMYYYVDSKTPDPFDGNDYCGFEGRKEIFDIYPDEARKLFPKNASLDQHAMTSDHKFSVIDSKNWPGSSLSIGQIAGLCLDRSGNVIIFHRSDRIWNDKTFNLTHYYTEMANGPIMNDTILTVNDDGSIIRRWGRGFFYMPHGIFMDYDGYLWTTDTAMHQVFKFDPSKSIVTPLLALGTKFMPGTDQSHFCKPSAVVVTKQGEVFVADGYCNDRLMKFDSKGQFLAQYGEKSSGDYSKLGTFFLPHALSVNDNNKLLYVADRENGRVQIFDFNGFASNQLIHEKFGSTVYGVHYCTNADVIYVINGESMDPNPPAFQVFAFDAKTLRPLFSFQPQTGAFQRPHVLTSSQDCKRVYVGEIGPNKLWRFEISSLGPSKLSSIQQHSQEELSSSKVANSFNTVSSRISTFINDESSTEQLVVIIILAVISPMILILSIYCCCRFRKRGGTKGLNLSLNYSKRRNGRVPLLTDAFYGRSHKGFRPLRQDDVDAMDDFSDDSDLDDTVYNKSIMDSSASSKSIKSSSNSNKNSGSTSANA